MFAIKLRTISNFLPLEVVGRDSETKLQVGEAINVAHLLVDFQY